MSLSAAVADVREAMATLQTKYFALQRLVSASVGSDTFPEVQVACELVSKLYGVGPLEIIGRCRTEDRCWARQVAITLCYEHGKMSTTQVGAAFGGRDHGTVIHSTRRVAEVTSLSAAKLAEVESLRAQFKARMNDGRLL